MEYKKERNIELDAARGLAILLVVLGHSIQCSNGMNPGQSLQQIIMTFWMPLFFILSGFTDGTTGGGNLVGWVRRLIDLTMAFSGSAAVFALIRGICSADSFARLQVFLSFVGRYTLELYAVYWCLLFNLRCGFISWPILFPVWFVVAGLCVWAIYQVPVLPLVAFGRTLRCRTH